jgi:hypothetical protein
MPARIGDPVVPAPHPKGLQMPTKRPTLQVVEETLSLPRLMTPPDESTSPGRKRKLKFPGLPQEIYDGMSEIERAHFDFFIEAVTRDNTLEASDYIGLYMAGLEYIQLLRMHARQLASGELISQARQHPGVQLRQWLETMSFSRKSRPARKDDDPAAELLKKMAG